jgi:S-adenosylmethionine uptake transporter
MAQSIIQKISYYYQKMSRPGYSRGVFWMIMVCAVSNLNDILIKFLGQRLPSIEVAFLRFVFSLLSLVPFVMVQGIAALRTGHPTYQILRSVLLFLGITAWCHGVCSVPLTVVTTLSFTVPLFVLPLAAMFLRERVTWQRWAATIVGFIGILVIANPSSSSGLFSGLPVMTLIAATLAFAALDIINKKIVIQETMLAMLFYSALGTSIISLPIAAMVWVMPDLIELLLLALLGIGANLILFCILKAFAATEVSALAPFRYVELVFSAIFGLMFFGELPTIQVLMGASIIVPSTLYLVYYESRQKTN